MDYEIESKFQRLKAKLEEQFGGGMDVQAILFLIGVHELGLGYQKFSKSEKTDLLHVAICTILEPYGHYTFEGRDEDKWPHYTLKKELPKLDHMQQQHLMKEALLDYFATEEYFIDDPLLDPQTVR
jgi:hypothetical protein